MLQEKNLATLSIDASQRIKERNYWLEKLSGELTEVHFPYDYKTPGENKRRNENETFTFTGELFSKLMKLSNNSDLRLYIFGAGHIGKALVYHLKNLDYFITLIDNREGMVDAIEGAQRRITGEYKAVPGGEEVPVGSFFIIASHSHALDYVILKRIYEADWKPNYIGLIASKKKAPAMIDQLKQELGQDINLDILYSPVGLDIGGPSPDEIAISIISELQAVRYGKSGHKHMKGSVKC